MTSAPVCERCGSPMRYEGRVTAPNQTIYGCGSCKHSVWVREQEPRGGQQQQQPQPDADKDAT
jgi:hypothetical protein